MARRKAGKAEKNRGYDDHEAKEKASLVFREVWDGCRAHKGYQEPKNFLREQKKWKEMERQESEQFRVEVDEEIKMEQDSKI
jgi:hypothetical protein